MPMVNVGKALAADEVRIQAAVMRSIAVGNERLEAVSRTLVRHDKQTVRVMCKDIFHKCHKILVKQVAISECNTAPLARDCPRT